MEETLFHKAELLWDKGEIVATNPDTRSSLYVYDSQLFMICYDCKNIVEKVEHISKEKAVKLFDPIEWRVV